MGYNSVADSTFSRRWFRNLRNPAKFQENSTLVFKVIDCGVNRKRIYDFLLVINSNSGRISYRFRDTDV